MGSTPLITTSGSSTHQKELLDKLFYLQNCKRSEGQIYRFKEPPYDYVVKHTKTFAKEDVKYPAHHEAIKKAADLKYHKNISQIHYYKVETLKNMCNTQFSIVSYSNFYTLTLQEVILQRKKQDIRFTPSQTWYVLKNLIEVAIFFLNNNFYFDHFKPSHINLSAEGYIKLSILHVLQDQTLIKTYTQILYDRRNLTKYLPFPPQFIPKLRSGYTDFKNDFEKEASFNIGMIIMEMLIDENVKKYYSLGQGILCSFKKQTLKQDIKLLRHVYGDHMMDLLEKMLEDNAETRIQPFDVFKKIEQIRDQINISGALRMYEDENNKINPKMSYRSSLEVDYGLKVIEQNIIQNKLMPGPIETFTKKSHQPTKSMCGVSLTSSKNSTCSRDKSFLKQKVRDSYSKDHKTDSLKIRMPR